MFSPKFLLDTEFAYLTNIFAEMQEIFRVYGKQKRAIKRSSGRQEGGKRTVIIGGNMGEGRERLENKFKILGIDINECEQYSIISTYY